MDDETILLLGAVAIGGFALYSLKDSVGNVTKPAGELLETTNRYLNLPYNMFEKITEKTNTNTIIQNNSSYGQDQAKKAGVDGVGYINSNNEFYGFGVSDKPIKSTQDFTNPKTQENLKKLFSNIKTVDIDQDTNASIGNISSKKLPQVAPKINTIIPDKQRDAINKAYAIMGVKTRI